MEKKLVIGLFLMSLVYTSNAQALTDGVIDSTEWAKPDIAFANRAGKVYISAGPTSLRIAVDAFMCTNDNSTLSGLPFNDQVSVIIDADNNKTISAGDHEFLAKFRRIGSVIKQEADVSGWNTGNELPTSAKVEYKFSKTFNSDEAHQCWEIEIPVTDFKLKSDSIGFAIRIISPRPVVDARSGAEGYKKYNFFLKRVKSGSSISITTYKAVNNGDKIIPFVGSVSPINPLQSVSKETLKNRYVELSKVRGYSSFLSDSKQPQDSMVVMSHSMAPTPPQAPQVSQSVQQWLEEVDFNLYFMILSSMTDEEKLNKLNKEMDSYANSYERISRQVVLIKDILNGR